jgi:hypothetical protein
MVTCSQVFTITLREQQCSEHLLFCPRKFSQKALNTRVCGGDCGVSESVGVGSREPYCVCVCVRAGGNVCGST